jgi:hypothetical protein
MESGREECGRQKERQQHCDGEKFSLRSTALQMENPCPIYHH